MMTTNQRSIDLIKHFEAGGDVTRYLTAYKDVVGVWTIGFGHTGLTHKDGTVYAGRKITENEAEDLLRLDLDEFEHVVSDLVEVELSEDMFGALVSFAFNLGGGNLRSSTLLKKLNLGDYPTAASEILKWNRAGGKVLSGLVRRRVSEQRLFLGLPNHIVTGDGTFDGNGPVSTEDEPINVEKRLQSMFDESGIKYFKAKEFLTLGEGNDDGSCKGKNHTPPAEYLPNILAIARVWDRIRDELGVSLVVNSCFRAKAYNGCVGGGRTSQHLLGKAADCASNSASPGRIDAIAKRLRKEGFFEGGIGIYNTFVHVDVRGKRATWDSR